MEYLIKKPSHMVTDSLEKFEKELTVIICNDIFCQASN